MTLRKPDRHCHDAHRFGKPILPAIQVMCAASRQQSSNQASFFNTEEEGRTAEHTEKQGFWRFAQEFDPTPREAPKLGFSVISVVLPFSSVLKTLACLMT